MSKTKDNTFVFTTGCPGSMWSMISHRVKRNFFKGFDNSDETPERSYFLPEDHKNTNYTSTTDLWKAKTHIGSYFGPDHGMGEKFDDLTYYDGRVEDFYAECMTPYNNPSRPFKLIKCHWFAYNLDWIWNNCKGHYLFMIWREPEFAEKWWYSMGGWEIKHPVYTWYGTPERMHDAIIEENRLIDEFGQRLNIHWYDYTADDVWIEQRFGRPLNQEGRSMPVVEGKIRVSYTKIV